jgi:hypothetical protein
MSFHVSKLPPGQAVVSRSVLQAVIDDSLTRIQKEQLYAKVKAADVILGLEEDQPIVNIFYGRTLVQKIACGWKTKEARVVCFRYSQATDELEALCALCNVCKGGCDYDAECRPSTYEVRPGLQRTRPRPKE